MRNYIFLLLLFITITSSIDLRNNNKISPIEETEQLSSDLINDILGTTKIKW
jgi:hypothetical protein